MLEHNDKRTVQSSQASRKAYEAPRLCCYGDVGAITQTVSNMGPGDSGGKNKTT